MNRVTPPTGRTAPLLLRALELIERLTIGRTLSPARVIAHHPGFLLPFVGLSAFVQGRGALDAGVRSLVTYLVAVRNGCEWCVDFGQLEAERRGLARDKPAHITRYQSDPSFSRRERAALALADAVLETRGHPADAVFAAARVEFSERELVEIAAAVSAENFFNWMNGTLGVESQSFCTFSASASPLSTAGREQVGSLR